MVVKPAEGRVDSDETVNSADRKYLDEHFSAIVAALSLVGYSTISSEVEGVVSIPGSSVSPSNSTSDRESSRKSVLVAARVLAREGRWMRMRELAALASKEDDSGLKNKNLLNGLERDIRNELVRFSSVIARREMAKGAVEWGLPEWLSSADAILPL
jgi:hypothetical protein